METITLTTKTLVGRKLFLQTVLVSALFHLLILGFMSIVFYWDLEAKWNSEAIDGMFRNERPSLSEEVKKQEQLRYLVSNAPVIYSSSYIRWWYCVIGIPLCAILVGMILSVYRSVTMATLVSYHVLFAGITLCCVLYAVLAVMISNTPFLIRGL